MQEYIILKNHNKCDYFPSVKGHYLFEINEGKLISEVISKTVYTLRTRVCHS